MPNTRELAQIIDRETGDVNNLRDKKLADATAQQQSGSASTDSVVMKTTGGEYVEIARDSFVGAIKSVMDGLIKGNSYTTLGANDPIAAFNSNALGGITPANLASVLGVRSFLRRELTIANASWMKFNSTPVMPNPSKTFMFEFWGDFSNNFPYGVVYVFPSACYIPTLKCGRADRKFSFFSQGQFELYYNTVDGDYYIYTGYNVSGSIALYWTGNSTFKSLNVVSEPDQSALVKLFSIHDFNGMEGW